MNKNELKTLWNETIKANKAQRDQSNQSLVEMIQTKAKEKFGWDLEPDQITMGTPATNYNPIFTVEDFQILVAEDELGFYPIRPCPDCGLLAPYRWEVTNNYELARGLFSEDYKVWDWWPGHHPSCPTQTATAPDWRQLLVDEIAARVIDQLGWGDD